MSIWSWILVFFGWFAAGVLWALAFRALGLRYAPRRLRLSRSDPYQLSLFDRDPSTERPERADARPPARRYVPDGGRRPEPAFEHAPNASY